MVASKNQNPREGIETSARRERSCPRRIYLQKTKIPARGLKRIEQRSLTRVPSKELQKTKIPARGLKPVTTACPVRIGDDTGDDASAWWRMAHVTHAMRMHGERKTTVPPSIPCVACTYASLGSMALPVSARPAVSFPTGIGRPRVAMYFPIPTGKGTPITDPGR